MELQPPYQHTPGQMFLNACVPLTQKNEGLKIWRLNRHITAAEFKKSKGSAIKS
jgi:hypothetical protein